MGVIIKKKFVIKKSMIVLAAISGLAAIVLNGVAMATDYWVQSVGCDQDDFDAGQCNAASRTKLEVNYGLFKGSKSIDTGLSPTPVPIQVFCGSGTLCILSCGKNEDEMRREFDFIFYGNGSSPCSSQAGKSRVELTGRKVAEDQFLDGGLRMATIVFLALTLFVQLVSLGLCSLNIFRVPIEWWQGPYGIHLANLVAVLTNMITLALWGALYAQKLTVDISIQETLLDLWFSSSTDLGFSFWISLGALVLSIDSSIAIYFRGSLQRFADPETAVEDKSTPTGAILLY